MPVVINGTTGITTPTESVATTIGVGGATPSASGAGITFPATQSASTDANTLDDYEEGSWTPTISNSGSVSYVVQYGRYVKVGRVVTIVGKISVTGASGSASLDPFIGGLPFAAVDAGDSAQRSSCYVEGDWTGCASFISAYGMFRVNTSNLAGVKNSGGSSAYALASDFSSSFGFNFHLTYLSTN